MKNLSSSLRQAVSERLRGREVAPFVFEINPVPASRPRVGRWGVYYSKTYKEYRKAIEAVIVQARRSFGDSPCAAIIEYVVARPKTTQRRWPRGDIDNYEKAVLDALTQHANVWKDDDQVVICLHMKRFAEPGETPGTYIEIWRLA